MRFALSAAAPLVVCLALVSAVLPAEAQSGPRGGPPAGGYRGVPPSGAYRGGPPPGRYYGGGWRGYYSHGWGAWGRPWPYRGPAWSGWGWGIGWPGWGWGWGWGPGWGWSVTAPIVVGPPAVGVWTPPSPTVYVERDNGAAQTPPPPAEQWWYWCASARGYYPYVKTCFEGWQRVAPQVPQ
jgi:hypothetical protein